MLEGQELLHTSIKNLRLNKFREEQQEKCDYDIYPRILLTSFLNPFYEK